MRNYRSRHRDGLIAATVRVLTGTPANPAAVVGTGFFVAPGLVVTSAHVVPDTPGAAVTVTYDGEEYPAGVLVRDPPDATAVLYSHPDVALLSVPLAGHPCVPLDTGPTPPPGRALFGYGCPLIGLDPRWEHMPMTADGLRTGLNPAEVWIKTSRAQVQAGASGAGAIDEQSGLLVGMLKLSRDPAVDLGGVLVPAATIATALAGHGVLAANQAATAGCDTVAAAKLRLGRLLDDLAGNLVVAVGIDPYHLRLMLQRLADDPPDPVDVLDAAMALLHLELDPLGDALVELARASHNAARARSALVTAASLAVVGGRPWVHPDAARQLIAERGRAVPRVVVVRAGHRAPSVELHAVRAAVADPLRVVPLHPPDAESDPSSGLPAWLVNIVRREVLSNLAPLLDDDPATTERLWAGPKGARARARAGRLLLVLPPGVADAAAITALQAQFPECLFAIAAHDLPPGLGEHDRVLVLPGSLSAEEEHTAAERYDEIRYQIMSEAG